LDNQLLRF